MKTSDSVYPSKQGGIGLARGRRFTFKKKGDRMGVNRYRLRIAVLFCFSSEVNQLNPLLSSEPDLNRQVSSVHWTPSVVGIKGTSWLYGVTIVGIWIFFQRKVFFKQLWEVTAWPSFLLLFAGGLIVIGWAQVLAQRALYVNLLDDTVTEEGLESAGYFLILFGIIEMYFELRRASGSSSRQSPVQKSESGFGTRMERGVEANAIEEA